ncbi:MAG: M14 family zinc carboxypeptidase, partial [Planctomycetota bacterium]
RKNRRDNGDGTIGVDLNRNYSFGFGLDDGSSSRTSSGVYRGTAAFSEPETQAVRDLMEGSFGRSFDTSLSYHSHGQLVLYPYNYTVEPVENVAYYDDIAAEMAGLINESHTNDQYDYTYGPSSERLYLASGTFTDWAHGTQDATAIVIELRPNGAPFFELPPADIIPTCRENLPAFLFLAEESMIPEARSADADADGFLDEDDYCLDSPTGSTVDRVGCAETEQDLDGDGVANIDDACPDTPPAQQIARDGCRVPTAFTLRVTSRPASVAIEVTPPDIDGAGAGDTGSTGFTREYGQETSITLTAPDAVDDRRFVWWVIDAQPQSVGQRIVTIDASNDLEVNAVYAIPRPSTPCGVLGLPGFLVIFGSLTAFRIARRAPVRQSLP